MIRVYRRVYWIVQRNSAIFLWRMDCEVGVYTIWRPPKRVNETRFAKRSIINALQRVGRSVPTPTRTRLDAILYSSPCRLSDEIQLVLHVPPRVQQSLSLRAGTIGGRLSVNASKPPAVVLSISHSYGMGHGNLAGGPVEGFRGMSSNEDECGPRGDWWLRHSRRRRRSASLVGTKAFKVA